VVRVRGGEGSRPRERKSGGRVWEGEGGSKRWGGTGIGRQHEHARRGERREHWGGGRENVRDAEGEGGEGELTVKGGTCMENRKHLPRILRGSL